MRWLYDDDDWRWSPRRQLRTIAVVGWSCVCMIVFLQLVTIALVVLTRVF